MAENGKVTTLLCGGTATKNLPGNAPNSKQSLLNKTKICIHIILILYLSESISNVFCQIIFEVIKVYEC